MGRNNIFIVQQYIHNSINNISEDLYIISLKRRIEIDEIPKLRESGVL